MKYENEPGEKKIRYDQHFMIDENILDEIISLAKIKESDRVVEVGTGKGALTDKLAQTGAKIFSFELDKILEPQINKNLRDYKNVKVTFGNFLEAKLPYFNKFVSNPPYAILEPMFYILGLRNFDKGVVVVPLRFASLLNAKEKSENFTKISKLFQCCFSGKIDREVEKDSFDPQPRVMSVIFVFSPLSQQNYKAHPLRFFMKHLLLQRDKKLKNALLNAIIATSMLKQDTPLTKRNAKLIIEKLNLAGSLLKTKVVNIELQDILKVEERYRKLN